MSLITDSRLLAELNGVDPLVVEWLKDRRNKAVVEMRDSATDRQASIAAGKVRELDDILKDIETAREQFERQKLSEAQNKVVNMAKAF